MLLVWSVWLVALLIRIVTQIILVFWALAGGVSVEYTMTSSLIPIDEVQDASVFQLKDGSSWPITRGNASLVEPWAGYAAILLISLTGLEDLSTKVRGSAVSSARVLSTTRVVGRVNHES